ncbi:MAG: dipeptide epimerase [Chloroflexaceae bacterium]|nr:dipeptide epimerase [Chloroflexaceae bacterium]
MRLFVKPFTVHKRFALTIARGTTAATTNLWLRVLQDGIEGWGEASPFAIAAEEGQTTAQLLAQVEALIPVLEPLHPWERQRIEAILQEFGASSAVRAGIDTAIHDWLGKRANLPLWRLWGLDRNRIGPISVTVGIGTPEQAKERTRNWLKILNASLIKVKLGNPDGIECDRAMLLAVREAAHQAQLTVDANGGWSLADARKMCQWLAGQGVLYVEQPLPAGEEEKLAELSAPLPIFVDESCWKSADIPRLAPWVQGVNLKLMKAGGLTEIQRAIGVARVLGLQVMFGCYSDSSLANSAMLQLGSLADYLDLDSHLNLQDDPFSGWQLENNRLLPGELPGLGITLREDFLDF